MVRLLRRYRRRPASERRLLRGTAILFALAHGLLRIGSLASTRRRLAQAAAWLNLRAASPAQLSRIIETVHRNMPGKHTCLVDALCCEAIARSSGIPADFKLGAAREPGGMAFHAWVEHGEHILAGEHDGHFTPLG